MRNEDYIPDIERQDQIAIDEKKKEREERMEEQESGAWEGVKKDLDNWAINSMIANNFYEFHDEVQSVREFVDANCKPLRHVYLCTVCNGRVHRDYMEGLVYLCSQKCREEYAASKHSS